MNTTTIKDVKNGDYLKRSATAKAVYVKGDYDRATKTYSIFNCDVMNKELYLKASAIVHVGFTY